MEQYTRRLAEFASTLTFGDLPKAVVQHAKLCLLDTIGCGLFGSMLPWARILSDCVREFGSGGPSTLWGIGVRVSPHEAALVNGTMVHGFELDDLHKRSIVHPGSVVTTSSLAVAEYRGGISGKRLITAMVGGYEVAARVGMSLGTAHLLQGWHPTGTHGTLGAAAAAGLVLDLSPDEMQNALGIAGSQSAGLMASQYSSMVKRFHAGRAAQSGVYAALLAKRGFTGITELFESEYGGYCSTFAPTCDRSKLTSALGEKWEIAEVGFKPYSTNGSCHTTIDALLALREEGLRPEHIDRVTLYTSSATKEHVGWHYVPNSITTAQMNLSYIAAVALTDGDAFVDQFTDERIQDKSLVALAERITVIADPEIDLKGDASRHAVRIVVLLKNGHVLSDSRLSARGSASLPLTEQEVKGKFRRLAGRVLPPAQVDRLLEQVYRLESFEDISSLVNGLVATL